MDAQAPADWKGQRTMMTGDARSRYEYAYRYVRKFGEDDMLADLLWIPERQAVATSYNLRPAAPVFKPDQRVYSAWDDAFGSIVGGPHYDGRYTVHLPYDDGYPGQMFAGVRSPDDLRNAPTMIYEPTPPCIWRDGLCWYWSDLCGWVTIPDRED